MNLLRASLLALLLGSSSASAASFYFGVRFDVPIIFEQVEQNTITTAIPMIGIHAGVDFDTPSSGLGLRLAFSSQIVSGLRGAFDWYYRFPIKESPDISPYLGVGATAMIDPIHAFYLNTHLLAGLEYQVSPGIGVFAEVSPGAALGFGRFACFGPPPLPDGTFPACGSFVPFTLESAIGLNFRF
jgi:hypothetical protein